MKIYKIREHIPHFDYGMSPQCELFSTKELFEKVGFVKTWIDDGYEIQYENSTDPFGICPRVTVMAIKGNEFWVVGYCSDDPDVESFFVANGYKRWNDGGDKPKCRNVELEDEKNEQIRLNFSIAKYQQKLRESKWDYEMNLLMKVCTALETRDLSHANELSRRLHSLIDSKLSVL